MGLVTDLRITSPEPIFEGTAQVKVTGKGPYPPAATPEDAIAREAAAQVEEAEGYRSCAEHRRRGAYDGDTEHNIALTAIRLFKLSQPRTEQ